MSLSIYITAYQRQEMLNELLAQLDGETVTVFDDASSPQIKAPQGVKIVRAKKNHGKQKYWAWVNRLIKQAKTSKGDVMVLPDDIQFVEGGLDETKAIFAQLKNEYPRHAICLNLLRDHRRANWTSLTSRKHNAKVDRTGWVDGLFICNQEFIKMITRIPEPPQIRWVQNPGASSGAWQYVTMNNFKRGARFFQVRQSLVLHGDHASVMHPDERQKNPINGI